MSPEAYEDKDKDLWVRTRPGKYQVSHSERHADSLLDSQRGGASPSIIQRLYGPLRAIPTLKGERHG